MEHMMKHSDIEFHITFDEEGKQRFEDAMIKRQRELVVSAVIWDGPQLLDAVVLLEERESAK
jgi:hypothetical protein